MFALHKVLRNSKAAKGFISSWDEDDLDSDEGQDVLDIMAENENVNIVIREANLQEARAILSMAEIGGSEGYEEALKKIATFIEIASSIQEDPEF